MKNLYKNFVSLIFTGASVTLSAQPITYNYTGSIQTYTVPACVTSITLDLKGAQGGASNGCGNGPGGLGANIIGTFAVTPGQTLSILVGGVGSNGQYNAGGGGGSFVWINGPNTLLAAAGGGGGGASYVGSGASGSATTVPTNGVGIGSAPGGVGGNGGSQGTLCYNSASGSGGAGFTGNGGSSSCGNGGTGGTAILSGGAGGVAGVSGGAGGYGGGGGSAGNCGAGGGGGGYNGGGGGNGQSSSPYWGSGGGGGSYNIGTAQTNTAGVQSGNGVVILTPIGGVPTPGAITGSASICAGASGNYSISSLVGATSYTWTVPAGTTINSGQGTTAITITAGSTSGNISVTATFPCGTSSPSTMFLTINTAPTVGFTVSPSTAVCVGSSVTLTGTGATTYSWTGGVTNAIPFVPVSTNTYTVTGTTSGCSNTSTVSITVNPLPIISANSSASTVCAGSSVTLTGGGATSYTWTGGVTNAIPFVPISTNTYTVTGTDVNGCVNSAATTVTVNPLPTIVANSTASVVCAGSSVTLTGSGATSYTWTGGATNAIPFVPTSTTTYTVTGTDVNGCTNTATTTVTVNALPSVIANSTANAICIGASVTLTGSGASTYAWSGGVSDGISFVPPSTTTYTVTGTDANGCVNTATTTVTVNPLPSVVANSTASSVCDGSSVTLSGSGATSYTWTGGVIDAIPFIPTGTTTYTVTGTDVNGCVNTATTTITVNANPIVDLGPDVTQCGGAITLDAGNAGSTYLWNNTTTSQTLTATSTGIYYVDVTDANGCLGSDTASITINAIPTVTASAANTTVCVDDASVALTGTPSGGTWSGTGVTGSSFSPATAGLGTQSVGYSFTDSLGCEGVASVSIQVNACVGVVETSLANGVSVLPNPNNGSFTLSVNANVEVLEIVITDIQGRIVFSSVEKNVPAGFAKQISLETNSSGMYLMHISANGEQRIEKVSVQK